MRAGNRLASTSVASTLGPRTTSRADTCPLVPLAARAATPARASRTAHRALAAGRGSVGRSAGSAAARRLSGGVAPGVARTRSFEAPRASSRAEGRTEVAQSPSSAEGAAQRRASSSEAGRGEKPAHSEDIISLEATLNDSDQLLAMHEVATGADGMAMSEESIELDGKPGLQLDNIVEQPSIEAELEAHGDGAGVYIPHEALLASPAPSAPQPEPTLLPEGPRCAWPREAATTAGAAAPEKPEGAADVAGARCSWPREKETAEAVGAGGGALGHLVMASLLLQGGARSAWPRARSAAPVAAQEETAAAAVGGARCAWPRESVTVEGGAKRGVLEDGPRCAWPRATATAGVPSVKTPGSADVDVQGPRCAWPRQATGAAAATEPAPPSEGPRCAWPRATASSTTAPKVAVEPAEGARCAWPREAKGASVDVASQPAPAEGPRCAWPRATTAAAQGGGAEGPRCAWPRQAAAAGASVPGPQGPCSPWPRSEAVEDEALAAEDETVAVGRARDVSVGAVARQWKLTGAAPPPPAPTTTSAPSTGALSAWPRSGVLGASKAAGRGPRRGCAVPVAAAEAPAGRIDRQLAQYLCEARVVGVGARSAWPRVRRTAPAKQE
ncbi:unnamed protein product [Pedinophyceae sp. YPF-701]|nr:unnamed protein product [Pedinophyceae sp. YPF-701]